MIPASSLTLAEPLGRHKSEQQGYQLKLELTPKGGPSQPALAATTKANSKHKGTRYVGILYGILASLFLSLSMLVCKRVKHLSGPEISWLRSCVMCALTFIYVASKHYKLYKYEGSRRLLFVRAICATAGSIALYSAILMVPLPAATSVKYCSVALTPFFAHMILKEKLSCVHVFSIVLCFSGIICIANPLDLFGRLSALIKGKSFYHVADHHVLNGTAKGLTEVIAHTNQTTGNITTWSQATPSSTNSQHPKLMAVGVSLAFVTSICEALAYCITRLVSRKGIPASVIVFNLSSYSSILSIPICLAYRAAVKSLPAIDLMDLLLIFLGGTFSVAGHMVLVKALHRENAGLISLVRAFDIVFSFVYQYAFFSIRPTYLTYIGAALIVTAVFTITIHKIRTLDHRQHQIAEPTSDGQVKEQSPASKQDIVVDGVPISVHGGGIISVAEIDEEQSEDLLDSSECDNKQFRR